MFFRSFLSPPRREGGKWLASYNAPPLGPGYFTVRYMADETRDSAREYAGARYNALYPRGRTRSAMAVGLKLESVEA